MSEALSAAARRAIELEERAHALRVKLLRTPGLVEDLERGLQDVGEARTYMLGELDRDSTGGR